MNFDRLECDSPAGLSLHELGLFETLSWLEPKPGEIVVFGIEPENTDWGMELSDAVNSKLSDVVGLVMGEL